MLIIQAVQWSKRPNHKPSQNAVLVRNLTFSEKGVDNSVSNYINKSVYFFLFWETLGEACAPFRGVCKIYAHCFQNINPMLSKYTGNLDPGMFKNK